MKQDCEQHWEGRKVCCRFMEQDLGGTDFEEQFCRVRCISGQAGADGLPPSGIGFAVFRMLWRTVSSLKRLEPIM